MRKVVVSLTFAVLIVGLIALGEGSSGQPTTHISHQQHETATADYSVPDHVVYGFLFRKVALLNERMRRLQDEGRGRYVHSLPLQREANLSQEQARVLGAIASACERELKQHDEKARVLIEEFRAQFPDRTISKSATAPPPPAELKTMWEERNAIILRERDRLRSVLGEREFYRLDQHAKIRFGMDDEYIKRRHATALSPALQP